MNAFFTCSAYVPYVALILLMTTFVVPSRLRFSAKFLLWLFFFSALMMFKGFRIFGGNAWRPELPETLIWTWCAAYFGSLLLAIVSPFFLWWKSLAKLVVLPVLAFSVSTWGVVNCIRLPVVRSFEISDPDLPAALNGYRIVQIADLHACAAAKAWRTAAIVRMANELDADLICLTGDQCDGNVPERLIDMLPLKDLRAKDGVFAVTGNHEHFYSFDAWRSIYRQLNVHLLENACAFPRPCLALAGVNAFNATGKAAPDVARAFAPATNGEYRVLLQHRPSPTADNFAMHRVNLQLSGHTHGGFMPILSHFVLENNEGLLAGIYPIGDAHVVVSSGCGPWPALPLRFFTPPEIILITLNRSNVQMCKCANTQ